ncbi:MAG: hypothetical protein JXA74_05155 [Anaerolineae bacterium]|nr:hypothetical protein [Anaerolineae bacterium]
MQSITVDLPRFAPMHGWTNRLLRVDLSGGRVWAQETAPMVPDFIGARGLAAKILWDEYPEPVDAFDPRNPLMIIPGALTGIRSPYSGRTNVLAFSPQAHPYTWFSRASMGAYFGDELKRAGYDGIIVTGASDGPVRILIQDDRVSILSAQDLWGLDMIETQEIIADGIQASSAGRRRIRTVTIGPAGENLSRIATIQTDTTSVAGQGGFGAVMGSKKLKAITVMGSSQPTVADPERLDALFRAVGQEVRGVRGRWNRVNAINEQLQKEGGGKARITPCTAYCPSPCRLEVEGAQGCAFDRKWSGGMACVSGIFGGFGGRGRGNWLYDWDFGFRGGFELNMYANRLGINHWEILVGMVPWLRMCTREGLLEEINGRPVDWHSLPFWIQMLRDIAYRDGMGDALAEGTVRAASLLDLGQDLWQRYYSGWGFSGHWDGHAAFVNNIIYPFWIAAAIHWAMDTRDPASSTHGYIQNVMYWGPLGFFRRGDTPMTWDHMRGIAQRVYGDSAALDPLSGYEGKEIPTAYHAKRSIMKDALPTDDQVFPLIYSHNTEDRFCRIGEPGGPIGVIEGPDVDAHLFSAGTGIAWDTAEFMQAAERVLNLERANTIRHWGRTRATDERVLPSFEYEENWVNPEIGERKALERDKFDPVMDAYLRRLGWDVASGWPTESKLRSLGLDEVYAAMVAGARAAQARLPELPPVPPVKDLHQYDEDRQKERVEA